MLHYLKIDIALFENWYCTIWKLILHYLKVDIALFENWYCTIWKLILHYLKVDTALFESWLCTIWKLILHYLKVDYALFENWYCTIWKLKWWSKWCKNCICSLSLSLCQSHPILSTIFYFIYNKISLISPDILISLSLSHFKY